jgi:putative transposase
VGDLFQKPYKAIVIQKASHLQKVCRHVVLNPVRAKAVEKVEQWTWSSDRETTSLATCSSWLARDWVLSQVGRTDRKSIGDVSKKGSPSIRSGLRAKRVPC